MPIPAHILLMAGGGAATSQLRSTLIAKGALGLWLLNDPATTTQAQDETSNNRDGTYSSSSSPPLATTTGPFGTYFNNSSANDIRVPDANDWSLTSGKTLFCCVKPNAVNVNYVMMAKTLQASNYEWTLYQQATGKVELAVFTNTAGALIRKGISTNANDLTTSWNCVAVTIDSTPSISSTITINVNGSWKTVTHSGSGGTYTNGTAELRGVTRQDTNLESLQGALAYMCVLPPLASGDVDAIMTAAHADGWF